MKIVRSRRPEVSVVVPIRGGYRVRFEDGRAVVPDDVATVLCGLHSGFYTGGEDVSDALKPGASVLLIRDAGLGDVLMLTPLIRKLHQDKGCVVDVLTSERYRCLFDGNPNVRRTFALEDEREKVVKRDAWDVPLDLRLVVENAEAMGVRRHRADAFAAMADITLTEDERRCDYFVTNNERDAAQQRLASFEKLSGPNGQTVKPIAYVWSASAGNRNWSFDTHNEVLRALAYNWFMPVVLCETEQETPAVPNLLDLTGELTVREAAAIIAQCEAVVSPDTGLFHLAGALDVPTVGYFGAFPASERQAHTNLTVLNNAGNCGLMPCYQYRCLNRDEDGQPRCLDVSPGRVLDALQRIEEVVNHAQAGNLVAGAEPNGPASAGEGNDFQAGRDCPGPEGQCAAVDPGDDPAVQR